VTIGDEVDVMILDIDQDRRRISLGIKQCVPNPWQAFEERYEKGDRVSGKIKSITDFGIFIGLDGGIDGLVHLSDISWEETGEEAVRGFSKGDELETVILSVDAERERISLGIKQLTGDPFAEYVATHEKGSVVTGKVTASDAKTVTVELIEGVEGTLKASEISRERVEDASALFKPGDDVEARITAIDRKNRTINLSIKAKEVAEEKEAIEGHSNAQDTKGPRTIGDLIKAQMESND